MIQGIVQEVFSIDGAFEILSEMSRSRLARTMVVVERRTVSMHTPPGRADTLRQCAECAAARTCLNDSLVRVHGTTRAGSDLVAEVDDKVLDALEAGAHVLLVPVGEAVVVGVRAQVGLVLDVLEQEEEGGSEGRSAQRRNPVDPVVAAQVSMSAPAVINGSREGRRKSPPNLY